MTPVGGGGVRHGGTGLLARARRAARSRLGGADELAEHVASGRLTIGRHTYGRPHIVVHEGDTNRVSIGAYCSIAAKVEIVVGGEHRIDWATTFPLRVHFGLPGAGLDGHPQSRGDVTIGNDVWIGRGARVMSGVTIGDGAVIGTQSLVLDDVPPYAIAVGTPARVVRHRFAPAVVDGLLRLRWWEWGDERVTASVDLLCGDPVELLRRSGIEVGTEPG